MVPVYMLTWLGYIDGIHVTIYSTHGSYGYLPDDPWLLFVNGSMIQSQQNTKVNWESSAQVGMQTTCFLHHQQCFLIPGVKLLGDSRCLVVWVRQLCSCAGCLSDSYVIRWDHKTSLQSKTELRKPHGGWLGDEKAPFSVRWFIPSGYLT